MSTTPDEFLQFAKEMGLGQIESTSLTSLPLSDNNGYTLTGLSVLNNLCHLIEHIHILKAENNHLRAHLELVNHVEKFISKNQENNKLIKETEKKIIHSTALIHTGEGGYDEDKSSNLSPSNSLKIKQHDSSTVSLSSRERPGMEFVNNQEYSSSMIHINHDQSEIIENNLGTIKQNVSWNKVRHALKFSLRRKQDAPTSPVLNHTERIIPLISISVESDDDHLHDNKHQKKKKKSLTTNNFRQERIGEDSDQDDESNEYHNVHEKRKLYQNDRKNSSSNERQDVPTPLNFPIITDDDSLLIRKQSKIAHYRRKIRSKLNTVKKQFSDQNSSSSRLLSPTHGSTFDNIGSGINHALLTAKLAPAMTKSYQQKMREWHTMQKSNFLVNYRRQSVINKLDVTNNSRKSSIHSTINEIPTQPIINSIPEIETDVLTTSPILSPNQRSLIVYQWRELMSEEIYLRYYNDYLQKKMQQLKQLETDLKSLKTSIFCTNKQEYLIKHRSMTSIEQLDQDLLNQHKYTYLPQRSRSYQSLITMPASWILAVQSAAYSDILDGTSNKTTERAIIFNKNFFNQLKHFKDERKFFQQDTMKDLQILTNSETNNSYEKRSRTRIILTRACLRKLSLITPTELPQLPLPLQTSASRFDRSSHIDLLSTPTSEPEPSLPSSSTTLNKRSKRSRFDFKKTLQRSKSMCMTQFNSWLQRRRQHHQSVPRRKSAIEPKTNKDIPSSPKLLGSPRLARLHQRIFKQHPSSSTSPPSEIPSTSSIEFPLLSSTLSDDSDQQFIKQEAAVRIYLPARTSPTIRHVRITDNNSIIKTPPMSRITSPILIRRQLSSSMKIPKTTKERRQSFTTSSTNLDDN